MKTFRLVIKAGTDLDALDFAQNRGFQHSKFITFLNARTTLVEVSTDDFEQEMELYYWIATSEPGDGDLLFFNEVRQ